MSVRAVLFLLWSLGAAAVCAQTVTLQGVMGSQALLVIDGGAPRGVAPGASFKGVKVISTSGDQAEVEIAGKRQTLRVGEAPASIGAASPGARGDRIVLTAGSGGHFTAQGAINGRVATFMVDTGATLVTVSAADAQRIGLNYRSGTPALSGTANGVVPVWRIKLASVRVGDVELYDVDALVSPQAMPFVLLGNSFLGRFQMKRDNDQMILDRRY